MTRFLSFASGGEAIRLRRENGDSGAGGLSRRQLLQSLATLGTGAILPAGGLMAQAASQVASGSPNRIDVHHHIFPPRYMSVARERVIAVATGLDAAPLLNWTPAKAIEEMDRNGVAIAMTSLTLPGVWFGGTQAARDLARACNEYAAQMAKDYPGRFGMLAILPLPDQEGSLREIEYALDTLKADGFALLTSYGDRWPGDPSFVPVFEELNRRKAVVHVHPTTPNCCVNLIPGVPSSTGEFLFDTARAIMSLMESGTFARNPDIRFIFSHAGGALPAVAHRLIGLMSRNELADRAPNGGQDQLKKLHYDMANSTDTWAMGALMNLVPVSQLLFGSDFPFVRISGSADGLDHFGLSANDLQAINRDNATRLFPRLKA